jgi:hypothetical protein
MFSLRYQLSLSDLLIQLLPKHKPKVIPTKRFSQTFLKPEGREYYVRELFDGIYEIEGGDFISSIQVNQFHGTQ